MSTLSAMQKIQISLNAKNEHPSSILVENNDDVSLQRDTHVALILSLPVTDPGTYGPMAPIAFIFIKFLAKFT